MAEGRRETKLAALRMKHVRKFLRWVWIYFLYCTGLLHWARQSIAAHSGIIVFTLHRVLDDAHIQQTNSPVGMIIRSTTFESFIQTLRKHGDVLRLRGESPFCETKRSRPRFAVTFDDGWQDTADVAYPRAEKEKVPIAMFVCPGLVGKSTPFWPERIARVWRTAQSNSGLKRKFAEICLEVGLLTAPSRVSSTSGLDELISRMKELPLSSQERIMQEFNTLVEECTPHEVSFEMDATMTWENIARLTGCGVEIGSHTSRHYILTTISLSAQLEELAESKQSIEEKLGRECKLFAYPNGGWSHQIRDLVEKEGYRQAFLNEPGVWTSDTNAFLIPRVNIWEGSVRGPSGRFSSVVFEYSCYWRPYRAELRRRKEKARVSRKVSR